ncbi:MAG: hypothetical protein ACREUF_06295 [Solimonas sp.]
MNRFNISRLGLALGLVSLALLGGCNQTGSAEEGIEVSTGAVNERSGATAKHEADPTTQTFNRADGRQIDLQKGFLNLLPFELEPCGVALQLYPLDWLLPRAQAHAGEEHGGVDGADGAIIDVSMADGTRWELGEFSPPAGKYCGLRVALVPVTSATAAPDAVDMSGSGLYAAPCYFYDSPADPSRHYCFKLNVAGGSDDAVLVFDRPLVLDSQRKEAAVTIKVLYDRWFDGLNLDGYPADGTAEEKAAFKAALQADEELKARFRANVLASLSASWE